MNNLLGLPFDTQLELDAAVPTTFEGSTKTNTAELSPGNAHDAPGGRELLKDLGPMPEGFTLLMDRAYEGNETRKLVLELGMVLVVPPKSNRVDPWRYDGAL